MNKDLKKKKYSALFADTVIFTLLALAGEFMSQKGLEFYRSGYFFSIAALPLFILLFRWGFLGLPSLFIFGFLSSFILTGATYETFIINTFGYPGLAMGMIFFLKSGRENICFFMHNAFLYILSGFAGMILIRTLILSFFEADFLSNLLLIAANETLSFIACSLLFIIMRRRKGYLVYLPDIYREKETDNKEDMKQGRFYSIRNM